MTALSQPLPHDAHTPAAHADAGWLKRYVFSVDHKTVGIQFLFMGLGFMLLGGLLAMVIRWQLAWPDPVKTPGHPVPLLGQLMGWPGGYMPPDFYNMAFTMHATVMIFFVIIPLLVGTFGNYLVPLKIGAADMAFPFLNGLAFWATLPAGAILLASFWTGAPGAGWTSYPPLSAIHGYGGTSSTAANLLRPAGSAWPMAPVVMTFATFALCFGFVAAYRVRLGHKAVSGFVGGLAALAAAAVATRVTQVIVFDGQSAWFFSLLLLGFASVLGAINYITTIVKLRCPGMTMFRLPLSVWSILITAVLVLLATPVLGSAMVLNLLDHHRLTSFFLPANWTLSNQIQPVVAGGGQALLHQHLFWFYSHPAVYIMILPAMGMVSDILSVFARKPVFGYRPMVYAMAAIAFLGFLVWAHHMFQSGMNPTLATTFAISTMFIAVPSSIKTFNWLGTLWGGNIRFTVPMLNAVAFVSLFVIGGLSGIFMASTPVDVHVHDTYFIVAHIHYVLFGGTMFGLFAAIYFWYPKMFGRMTSNWLGYTHFFLSFVAFNCTFFPMHILGIGGFPRRVANYLDYPTFAHFLGMNQFITYSAFVLGLAQVPFAVNFLGSLVWGKRAPQNPWQATTLEWHDAPTPVPHGNFPRTPVVHHGPYEYNNPLVEEDWLPQTREVVLTGETQCGGEAKTG
ncbi:MAG TPA: cbb3-type cytochrome c oxidase subunit I [Tepidisphaeraceae bacterium]|nr:cbb3-type cytochrome c oxidase subunit I [Tepidisphaeraceae bacterium]